jgi:hypothetical protein
VASTSPLSVASLCVIGQLTRGTSSPASRTSQKGLTLLGTEASGGRAMPLCPSANVPPQTLHRKARAMLFSKLLVDMIALAPAAGACHAAFAVARGLVAHSLEVGASMLPSCVMQQHVRDLNLV